MATPDQERNVELARGGLESWVAGDAEATLATFSDDVETYVPQELGNAGTYHGKDQFLQWTRQWDDAWDEFRTEIREVMPVGERHVVVTVHNWGRGRGSGIEVENEQGWVLGVRKDTLCDFISLQATPEDALKLAREREASGSA